MIITALLAYVAFAALATAARRHQDPAAPLGRGARRVVSAAGWAVLSCSALVAMESDRHWSLGLTKWVGILAAALLAQVLVLAGSRWVMQVSAVGALVLAVTLMLAD
jgi:hypothetical protein